MVRLDLLHLPSPLKLNPPVKDVDVRVERDVYRYMRFRNTTVYQVSKPTILAVESTLPRLVRTVLRLGWILLDFTHEQQQITLPMLQGMHDRWVSFDRRVRGRLIIGRMFCPPPSLPLHSKDSPITHAYLRIDSSVDQPDKMVRLYAVKIRVDAHFAGLQYFMYYWFLPTATLFVVSFAMTIFLASVIAWWIAAHPQESPFDYDRHEDMDGNKVRRGRPLSRRPLQERLPSPPPEELDAGGSTPSLPSISVTGEETTPNPSSSDEDEDDDEEEEEEEEDRSMVRRSSIASSTYSSFTSENSSVEEEDIGVDGGVDAISLYSDDLQLEQTLRRSRFRKGDRGASPGRDASLAGDGPRSPARSASATRSSPQRGRTSPARDTVSMISPTRSEEKEVADAEDATEGTVEAAGEEEPTPLETIQDIPILASDAGASTAVDAATEGDLRQRNVRGVEGEQ